MTQAVTYERETKAVAFQGKIIVLEKKQTISLLYSVMCLLLFLLLSLLLLL